MIILSYTDSHCHKKSVEEVKKKAGPAEIITCNGDFTIFGHGLSRELKAMSELDTKKTILVIPGNHEEGEELEKECSRHKNLVYLHKKFHEAGGILFTGYGGGGFSQRDPEFEEFSKEISRERKGRKLVVIFHMPPYKTKVDDIYGSHVGSKSYTDFIKDEQPDLVLCGHIHEGFGKHDKIGKSTIVNPGPGGQLISIE